MRSLLALPLALAGCWMPNYVIGSSASEWYDLPVVAKSPRDLAQICRDLLQRQGFRVLTTDPAALFLETAWDLHLSSHWRVGFRSKVEIDIEATEDGRSLLRVRSHREVNDNAKNPLNESAAIWGAGSLDDQHAPKLGEPALRIRQLLKLKLEGTP